MQDAEAEPWMRPLQNQWPVVVHFTTAPGLWIPQYLRGEGRFQVRRRERSSGLVFLRCCPCTKYTNMSGGFEVYYDGRFILFSSRGWDGGGERGRSFDDRLHQNCLNNSVHIIALRLLPLFQLSPGRNRGFQLSCCTCWSRTHLP